ncbi:hypothetical protein LZ198_16475 [Myxococcus sp. K15C18031901]|nr:hypothetical protein [Myxococcus dinghuensis]MCP3100466.1 hypothetical protein [Myxococcus dinghuensis]
MLTVDTQDFPRLTRGKWGVARFVPSREEAEAALARLRACGPDVYVKRVQ